LSIMSTPSKKRFTQPTAKAALLIRKHYLTT
jgi:hypothetical protein